MCRVLKMRGKCALASLIIGFVLHIIDVALDIYVAIQYYIRGERWWFALTLTFIILPVIITVFSACAVKKTARERLAFLPRSLCLVFYYYVKDFRRWQTQYLDTRDRPCGRIKNYSLCTCERCKSYFALKKKLAEPASKLTGLRYLESIAESAPQWSLQNYIMLRQWYFPWYTVLSTVFSFLSLVWSITTLEKAAPRLNDWLKTKGKETISATKTSAPWYGMIVFFAWQFCGLLSRLTAFVVFGYVFNNYVFIILGFHWSSVAVVSYIVRRGFTKVSLSDLLLSITISYCSMFHISKAVSKILFVKDLKNHRLVMFLYQFVISLENILTVSLAVWFAPVSTTHIEDMKTIVLCFVFVGLIMATILMILYYQCFQPVEAMEPHTQCILPLQPVEKNGNKRKSNETVDV